MLLILNVDTLATPLESFAALSKDSVQIFLLMMSSRLTVSRKWVESMLVRKKSTRPAMSFS